MWTHSIGIHYAADARTGGVGVALLLAEDDLSATILPRLDAAAEDMERMDILRGALTRDVETGREWQRLFLLPQDIPLLEETIQEKVAKLLVIDPLMAYLECEGE